MHLKTAIFWIQGKFVVKILAKCREKIQSRFYPGDVAARMGDREICSVSGRLPDNLGELAYMHVYKYLMHRGQVKISIVRGLYVLTEFFVLLLSQLLN